MPRISLVTADSGWIMEEFARQLVSRIPGAGMNIAPEDADLVYFLPYSAWRETVCPVTVALFTHLEDISAARKRFFEVARRVDYCVTMAARYEDELRSAGIDGVRTITPGVDLNLYTPRLTVGVVGRTYHTGRKGEAIVLEAMKEPGVDWYFTGDGWPGPAENIPVENMPAFYRAMDYIVVPSLIEGGPMCVLEALACGCEVIAPDVGFVRDYPHIPFALGSATDLRRVLRELLESRKALAASVAHRTWEVFAREHEELFCQLLRTKSDPLLIRDVSKEEPHRSDMPSLKPVLILHDSEAAAKGGPGVRTRRTVEAMRALGVAARLAVASDVRHAEIDVAHVFNVWPPHESLITMGTLFREGPPTVFSPIFLDLRELRWVTPRLRQIFSLKSDQHRHEALARLASLSQHGSPALSARLLADLSEYFEQVRQMIEMADTVIYLSEHERKCLREIGAVPSDESIIRNGVNSAMFRNADPRLFQERYEIKDYVLCVGRLEVRKNQLLLAEALRGTALPVVFVGAAGDVDYAQLVRANAGPRTRFVDYIKPDSEMLASAFAGCRVFALPSFCEGAPLVALEAGAAGARLVLSNRSAEREYFGALADYCDPASVTSIHDAVVRAFETGPGDRRKELQEYVSDRFDIRQHAAETINVYRRLMERTQRRAPSKPLRADRPIYIDVTSIAHARGELTGMYRTELMVATEFVKRFPDRVRLCVWNGQYREVAHDQFLSGAYREMVQRQGSSNAAAQSVEASSVPTAGSDRVSGLRHRLPDNIKSALRNAARAYSDSVYITYRAATYPVRASIRRLRRRLGQNRQMLPGVRSYSFAGSIFVRHGLLFVPGSAWVSNQRYTTDLIRAVRTNELGLAAIVYDILPVDYPEFVLDENVHAFKYGLSHLLRRSQLLLTISEYTRRQLHAYAAGRRFELPRVTRVRLGEDVALDRQEVTAPENEVLKALGGARFVAFVSTINPRKNHAMIYRVWQRLRDITPARVPHLAFIGRKGWESDDLLALLGRDKRMEGIVHVTGPVSETDMNWVYKHCLFTVYPSLAEGWGLPIAESLMYQKVCVCSNATAMDEVGRGLTISLDPLDSKAWVESLLLLIEKDDFRKRLEAEIAAKYRPMRWSETASVIWEEIQTMSEGPENRPRWHIDAIAGSQTTCAVPIGRPS